jgi:hypothetical protein
LYPKYDITIDTKRQQFNYSYKYFKSAHYYGPSYFTTDKNMLDVYTTINYIVPFLLENNFIRTNPHSGCYINKNFNILIIVRHNGYLLFEGECYCAHNSNDFIERIKQLLGVETPFKKVLND